MRHILDQAFIVGLFAATIRVAAPLLLCGLGETLAQRSGVMNLGIEGLMLVGALAGFMGSYFTGIPWVGLVCAMLAALLVGLVHAWLSIGLGADQVVSGIGIILLSSGLATFVHRAVFGISTLLPKAKGFPDLALPLASLPYLGPILLQQNVFVYLGLMLVPIAYGVLFHTTWGLRITATGENPWAAESAGVNVPAVRYLCVATGAMLAGVAGAALSLGQLNFFKQDMVAGRGFIAIAVVIFGRWNPVGALGAALLFGLAEATQIRLQALGLQVLPPQILSSLPYLVTLFVVLGGVGNARPPSALCIPFVRWDKK